MRIATRACIDASRRRHIDYDETKLATVADAHDVSEAVEEKEHRHLAWQALGALPQRQRLALYLREVDGMRYTDIAEAIGYQSSLAWRALACRSQIRTSTILTSWCAECRGSSFCPLRRHAMSDAALSPVARFSPVSGLFVDRTENEIEISGTMELFGPEANSARAD